MSPPALTTRRWIVLPVALVCVSLQIGGSTARRDPFFGDEATTRDAVESNEGCGACRLARPTLEVLEVLEAFEFLDRPARRAAPGWFLGLPDGLLVATQPHRFSAVSATEGGVARDIRDVWLVGTVQPRVGVPEPGLTGGTEASPEEEDAWHAGGGLRYTVHSETLNERIDLDTENRDGSFDSKPRIGIRVRGVRCGEPVTVEVHVEGGLGVVGSRITLRCACERKTEESGGEGELPSSKVEVTAKRFPPGSVGLAEWAASEARWWRDL